MKAVIVNISVEFLFSILSVFVINISQFDYSLITAIYDSRLFTKISLEISSRL